MNEATLKQGLVKEIKRTIPNVVVFRHEDKFTAGIPDLSVSYLRGETARPFTHWLEVKYCVNKDHSVRSRGIQMLQFHQLDRVAVFNYVVYDATTGGTYILLSSQIVPYKPGYGRIASDGVAAAQWSAGYDHKRVANFLLHGS